MVRSTSDLSSDKVDLRFVNPQTGPLYVEGAEPSDTLAIHIVDLTPARNFGASAAIPFFGGLTSTGMTSMLHEALPDTTWIYHVNSTRNRVGFESRFGGNMDSPEVKAGTTVFLGVNVPGALFSLGDGHYRQGEGESCGTSVEGAMNSVIIVEPIKGYAPEWPRFETDDYWMAVGSARPLEDSWRIGNVEMVRWLEELYGLHPMDAYQRARESARTLCPREIPILRGVCGNRLKREIGKFLM